MQADLFVGRREELKDLKALLAKRSASLVVIRGRRRIGKSRLVDKFAEGKPSLVLTGLPPETRTTAQLQREEFARQLQEKMGLPKPRADDWGDLFTTLARAIPKGRFILLLDEITWMGSKDPTFLGKLKIAWDQYFSKMPHLILILCGSISSWIEKNIISSTGFFGRISHKIYLQELSLAECNQLLQKAGFHGSVQEKFILLSVTGGIPWYLEQMNPRQSAQENIARLCFSPNGLLVDEFKSIFHDLFGKRFENHRKIVEFLSNGPADYTTIAENIHYASSGKLSEYLEELILAGYLGKEHTWSLKSGRQSRHCRYRIKDNFVRFYLKYMAPNLHKIERHAFKNMSLFSISAWDAMIGLQFENLVINNRDLLLQELGIRPEDVLYDNPYFQKESKQQKSCQVDYLIETRYGNLLACEIKFSRNAVSSKITSEMQSKLKCLKIPKGHAVSPVLIHVNGVMQEVEETGFFAKIIDFGDLLQI